MSSLGRTRPARCFARLYQGAVPLGAVLQAVVGRAGVAADCHNAPAEASKLKQYGCFHTGYFVYQQRSSVQATQGNQVGTVQAGCAVTPADSDLEYPW